jgi:PIN domain nuclease of toxin-antitoxin system
VKLLLDAHALIWAVDDPSKLSPQVATMLQDPSNELLVSAGTIWELSIKVGLGKLTLSMPFREWITKAMTDLGAAVLPIEIAHADAQSLLPGRGDPFDRLLVAQSSVESITIVSNDADLDQYGLLRLW